MPTEADPFQNCDCMSDMVCDSCAPQKAGTTSRAVRLTPSLVRCSAPNAFTVFAPGYRNAQAESRNIGLVTYSGGEWHVDCYIAHAVTTLGRTFPTLRLAARECWYQQLTAHLPTDQITLARLMADPGDLLAQTLATTLDYAHSANEWCCPTCTAFANGLTGVGKPLARNYRPGTRFGSARRLQDAFTFSLAQHANAPLGRGTARLHMTESGAI